MRILILSLYFSLFLMQAPVFAKSPKPVEYVNPNNFSGLWYEIARTYNSFEKDCVAASVEYKLIESSKYEVTNRCFKNKIGGDLIIFNGTAEPLKENNMSQVEKTYFWIFSKKYNIVYLDENYETAVMSDDSMKNLWIINRKPFIQEDKLKSIVSLLDKYMDVSKLIYTPQDKNGRYK